MSLSELIVARNALAVQYNRFAKLARAAQRRERDGKTPTRAGRSSELAMSAGEVKMLYDRDDDRRRRADAAPRSERGDAVIGPSTTLGDLEVKLAAFGLRCEFAPIRAASYYEVALVDPDGVYGYAKGSTMSEALDSAFGAYVAKRGSRLLGELYSLTDQRFSKP